MEDQPNESYEEKADLEKHEIPQDTLVNNQNQEILTRNEIPQNQEIKNEEDKENSEAKKAEEEQNEEELNEMDDNANEENEGEDVNENEEHEENNENQEEENNDEIKDNNEEIIEENKENNENNEDVEPDENEENQEEANSDNNEEEDSHKNQPEEQQQNEYKERQAIHIHRENEEDHEQNNGEEEENIEESGKIHPIEENSEDKEEIKDEENVENKILQKVEKEQEKRIRLESTEPDAQGEEGKEKEQKEEQVESHKEYSKKKSEPLDGESQKQDTEHITHISHKIEKKIKTNQKNIPNIMVFEKYQSERSSLINENSVDRDVQVIERKLDINNIDFKTLVEIPINERYKYENKEIISLQGGMAPGEYKFEGEEIELRHKEPGFGSVEITKEEIMNEINKRNVKSKEKKISYEIVDRYYYVPIYGEKFEKIIKIIKSSPEDNYSKYLLEQINKIRTDPKSFIGVIEDAKDNIKINKEGICYYKSNKLKVCLNEGESAFNDSIEFLKNCQPMEPLEFSPSLIPDLPTTVNEMNNINYLKISIKKMMNDGLKINSYWRNVIKDPEICFLLMIVDDNDKSKGMKRVDILNPKMKYIGLSSVEIDGKFMNYIVLSE